MKMTGARSLANVIFLAGISMIGLFETTPTRAQDLIKTPGDVQTVKQQADGLEIKTGQANVRLTVYGPGILRVRISDKAFKDDFSYAVVAIPGKPAFTWQQTSQRITLHTDSLNVIISKSPFSIVFSTPDGKVLNEDEAGLGTAWQGNLVTTYKHLQPGERFIGLGEKTGNLDRAGSGYTNANSDVYGYSVSQDPLYSTIPFYIGIHDGLSYGIFLDNTYQSDFNFGASNNRFSSFGAHGGEMNYYFIHRSSIGGIIQDYTQLTGRMPMPPLWSLGYQQNRYSYFPESDVLRIAQTLREKRIPADGITLDIHYMDHYKLFTWNKDRFPQPKAMIGKLNAMGFHTTVIVDPGVKVEQGYPAFEDGLKKDIFIKYPDGTNYTGQVWPGWCHFPDFTSPKGREWWHGQVRNFTDSGVSGIWNDMNEISTWGQQLPANILFNYDGHTASSLQARNVFGLQMARSSYEGSRALLGGKRPFILSRSGYAGLQRYSAIWTGDNRAEDDHMLLGVRLLQSLGLSGIAFSAMDIGGFTGNPSTGLYTRWMQLGAFIPYFRQHTGMNSRSAEPWIFGEDVLDICRQYIGLRYTLLPYIYSCFYEAHTTGMPLLRSQAISYTNDPKIYDPAYQNQFLCGPSILVMPQISTTNGAKIYLPAGRWYNAYTDEQAPGNSERIEELTAGKLPVYIRAGSIIPRQALIQYTGQQTSDTLQVHVYKGGQGGDFQYYEDDGETYAYEKGGYFARNIHYDATKGSISMDAAQGSYASRFRYIRFVLHGFDQAMTLPTGAEQHVQLSESTAAFLPDPESGLEGSGNTYGRVKTFTIANDKSACSFQL